MATAGSHSDSSSSSSSGESSSGDGGSDGRVRTEGSGPGSPESPGGPDSTGSPDGAGSSGIGGGGGSGSGGGSGPDPGSTGRSARTAWAYRGLGVGLAALAWLLLGLSDTLEPDARNVAAVGVLMATWWITEAIPLPATALIPIVAFPLLGVGTVREATERYADPIVFLFLGGFLIAIAMQKWHLHRRIALLTLRTVGTTPNRIVLGMMIACGFLALWVSNTAVALMMLPIALSVLALVAERCSGERPAAGTPLSDTIRDPGVRTFGIGLMLAVAWSSSIGGLGSLVATVPNAMLAAYLSDELGITITFLDWMMLGVPLSAVFILLTWLLITRVLFRTTLTEVPGGREMIAEQLRGMGPVSTAEKRVLAVFAGAATMWIVPGLVTEIDAVDAALPWLGGISDSTIAVAAGIALFLLPASTTPPDEQDAPDRTPPHRMLLNWDDAQKGLPWACCCCSAAGSAWPAGSRRAGWTTTSAAASRRSARCRRWR